MTNQTTPSTSSTLASELADCGNINVQNDDAEDTGIQCNVELPRTTARFTIEGPRPWQEIFLTKWEMTGLRDAAAPSWSSRTDHDGVDVLDLLPDEARQLAAFLLKLADVADGNTGLWAEQVHDESDDQ